MTSPYQSQRPAAQVPFPVQILLSAAGAGTARFQNPLATSQYKITSVAVGPSVPSSVGCTCVLNRLGFQLIASTPFAGSGDTAGGDPVYLNGGEYIDAVISGGPANGSIPVVFYYEEIPYGGTP